ncbi:MAG: hypothetical protein AB8B74_05925 [Crocinitomicaceae bacterium]
MKFLLTFILVVIQLTICHSQSESGPFSVSASYFGDNGFHPGLKFSGYYDFINFEKSKKRKFKKGQEKKGDKLKYKSYYGVLSLGGYSHANNHNGWFGNVGAGYERVNARQGRLFGYSLNLGYLYRDYKFDTYQLVENEIESIGLAGSGGVVFSLSPHFGRDLSVKTNIPLKVQIKPIIQVMQYNHGFVPNAALEFEFIYHF